MSLRSALFVGASLAALAGAAHAEGTIKTTTIAPISDTRDARIEALESSLSALQQQLADLKAGTAADTTEIRRIQAQAPVVDLKGGRPTFSSADGNFKVAIRGLFQADAGLYNQDNPNPDHRGAGSGSAADNVFARDLSSGVNIRRARIGLEGTAYKNWNWALTYDAGGSGSEAAGLQQAWLEYAGFKPYGLPLRIKAGAFAPTTGFEDATANTDSLFPERAAAADLVRNLTGGDGRNALGLFVNGERWNAEAVWTGSSINTPSGSEFDEQSGYVLRLDGLAIKSEDLNVHVGAAVNGIAQLSDTTPPGSSTPLSIRLRERPELRDDGTRLIDTGNLSASSLIAYSGELGLQYKNLLLAGEYFNIDVDRPGALPDPSFDGWYVQGSWILTGEQRKWSAVNGGFGGIKPARPFDPSKSQWGAWEIAARYSTLDLNDNAGSINSATPVNGIRGGQQDVTSVGVNFYPNSLIRITADYQDVSVDRLNPTTAAASGVPLGAQIGQDYNVLSVRTQVAF